MMRVSLFVAKFLMWFVVNIFLVLAWVDPDILIDEDLSSLNEEEAKNFLITLFGQLFITGYLLF